MSELNIAIIGMAGTFPGADSVDKYWNRLLNGEDLITRSKSDTDVSGSEQFISAFGKIQGVYEFDNSFFKINNVEALELDPQERKLMEVSYHALEDAGISLEDEKNNIGLVCTAKDNDYSLKKYYENDTEGFENETSKLYCSSLAANRIAYKMNLQGPCLQVRATCASSIVSVHTAAHMLRNFEADIMLAGGVNISLNQKGYFYINGGITSADGYGRAFSRQASGCVPGDGLGIVVLKRLEDAQADHDQIIAVIAGSVVENDGNRKMGFTAPSIDGEYEAIKKAQSYIESAESKIRYIETHGTGTSLGDLVEIKALKKAFPQNSQKTIVLGAVKNNIGHLNYAAGIASVIKTAMILNQRKIPPTLNAGGINVELVNSAFEINMEVIDLSNSDEIYAGVSGFGMGGVNTHMILKSYPQRAAGRILQDISFIILISAKTKESLLEYEKQLEEFLIHNPDEAANTSYTLMNGRKHYDYRDYWIVTFAEEKLEISKSTPIRLAEMEHEINKCKLVEHSDNEYLSQEHELQSVGKQWQQGYQVLWEYLCIDLDVHKISLPKYYFKKSTFNYFEPFSALTSEEVNHIREIEIQWEKNMELPGMRDYPGLEKWYMDIPVYAALDYVLSNQVKEDTLYSIEKLLDKLQVISAYRYFPKYLFRLLQENKFAEIQGDAICFRNITCANSFQDVIRDVSGLYPEFELYFRFVESCVKEYNSVFRGEKPGNSILYPDGSYNTITEIAKQTPDISRKQIYQNAFGDVMKYFITKNHRKRKIKILEVGSGTGIISWKILKALKGYEIEYYFTDLGKSFLSAGKRKAEELNYQNVIFRQFDLEKSYLEQGFESETFNFIVSLDVIQVTSNMKHTVERLGGLLTPDGIMAMVQSFNSSNMNYLCYGFSPGWWNYEQDEFRSGKNIMPPIEDWRDLLTDCNYQDITIISDSLNQKDNSIGFIFASRPLQPIIEQNLGTLTAEKTNSKGTESTDEFVEELLRIIGDTVGERVYPNDDLMECGLDSLSMLIVSAKIKEKLHTEISVDKFYELESIQELANHMRVNINKRIPQENAMITEELYREDIFSLLSEVKDNSGK